MPCTRSVSQACSGAGEWRAALSILDDVHLEGLRPSGAAYVAAMGACARGGVVDLALELLDKVLVEHPGDKRVRVRRVVRILSSLFATINRSAVILTDWMVEARVRRPRAPSSALDIGFSHYRARLG